MGEAGGRSGAGARQLPMRRDMRIIAGRRVDVVVGRKARGFVVLKKCVGPCGGGSRGRPVVVVVVVQSSASLAPDAVLTTRQLAVRR